MGPTATSTGHGVQDVERAPETPVTVKAKRNTIWPALIIVVGLLLTIAWSGFLGWAILWMIGIL